MTILLFLILLLNILFTLYLLYRHGKVVIERDALCKEKQEAIEVIKALLSKRSRLDKVMTHCERREKEMAVLDSFRDN